MQAAAKEATLAAVKDSVAAAEAAGGINSAALESVSAQMAELREGYLGWQQSVVGSRIDTLKRDADRVSENDRLKARCLYSL